jgi:hypothetical protein
VARSSFDLGVYDSAYRDKKVVGVFVRFSCAASPFLVSKRQLMINMRLISVLLYPKYQR